MLGGRYEAIDELGRGGQATVFRGRDTWRAGAEVVLKRVDDHAAAALRQEFRALRLVSHAGLVAALDLFTHEGATYLVEELVIGEPMVAWARWRTPREVLCAVAPVAHALAHLHGRHLVHMDASPANILVRPSQPVQAVLLDLGLARATGGRGAAGTPGFVAPEVLSGEPVTGAADIYTLGCTLVCALAGVSPAEFKPRDVERITPDDVRELLAECLRVAPSGRPDALRLAQRCAKLGGLPDDALPLLLPTVPLCGRERELATFDAWLANATASSLAVVGPDGAGKSSLLSVCADRARLRGFTVLEVAGDDEQWLDRLAGRAFASALQLDRVFADAPGLSDRLHREAGELQLVGRTVPERVDVLVRLLDGVSAQRPLLVMLDDLDEATSLGAELLRVARRPGGAQARLVVGAARVVPALGYQIELGPLDEQGVAQVLTAAFAQTRPLQEARSLLSVFGGLPGDVVEALRAAARRRVGLEQLTKDDRSAAGVVLAPVLAPLQTTSRAVPRDVVDLLGGTAAERAAALTDAMGKGWLVAEADPTGVSYRCVERARRGLAPELTGAAARRLAIAYQDRGHFALAAPSWALAGEAQAAVAGLRQALPETPQGLLASVFAETALRLGTEGLPTDLLERWAEVAVATGDARGAAHMEPDLVRRLGQRAQTLLAALDVRLGRYEAALGRCPSTSESPECLATRARALYFVGRAAEARQTAEQGLRRAAGLDRAELLDVAGHSALAVGDSATGRAWLEEALAVALELGDAERVARAQGALALAAQRTGEHERALKLYEAALAHGDPLALVVRVSNLGTLLHETGHLTDARKRLREALARASQLGNVRQRLRAGVNLANVELALGELASGGALAEELLREAQQAAQPVAALRSALIAAEAQLSAGNTGRGRELLGIGRELAETHGDATLRAELTLLEARLDALESEPAKGVARCASLNLRELPMATGRVAGLLKGQLELAASPSPEVLARVADELTALAHDADAAGDVELAWRAAANAARAWGALGRPGPRAAAALEARQFLALLRQRLGEAAMPVYLGTSERMRLHRTIEDTPAPVTQTGRYGTRLYKRLAAVNRRLAREADVNTLLAQVIDAAVELLGAERGFLLLRAGNELEVAVARNLDQVALAPGSPLMSRGIAQTVVEQGLAVLTVNATEDERFAGRASVAAMQVRSVLCVPLRGASATDDPVIGALYLDHQTRVRAFDDDDVDVAEAFADQAAMALQAAQQVARIRQQEVQLVAQNRSLEELNQELQREVATSAAEAEAALRKLRDETATLGVGRGFERFVGRSTKLREILRLIERFADTDVPILVLGESGTGKELVARATHERSRRAAKPFVSVNCGAIPEQLFESEFFGYKRGAFTGAQRDKHGLLAAAQGGTLFLDEVAELPLLMQVKLLRVLQEHEYVPVGATNTVRSDVRIVAATHRDLETRVREGAFREDLYYRLNVVALTVPPLRERREDILPLVEHFVRRTGGTLGAGAFSKEALQRLVAHDWPGNVRELENEVTRALALAEGEVRVSDLSERLQGARGGGALLAAAHARGSLREIMDGFERNVLLVSLRRCDWNVRKTAKELGLSRAALYTRLTRLGIERELADEDSEA